MAKAEHRGPSSGGRNYFESCTIVVNCSVKSSYELLYNYFDVINIKMRPE